MYDSIRSIIYGLLRHQNNWCQYCGERALTGNGAKGMAVILSPTTVYWTHTRLNSKKRTLLPCWGSYFSRPFIMWMSLSKATQERAEVWLLGFWQCSCGRGRIQSTELLHITVPLPNMGLCTVISSEAVVVCIFALSSQPPPPHFPKVEWKHKELMQGDWMSSLSRLNRCADPRGLVKKSKRPT